MNVLIRPVRAKNMSSNESAGGLWARSSLRKKRLAIYGC